MLFRCGGVSLEKRCVTFLTLKIKFACTPMSRPLRLIFVMPCAGVEPRLLKHYGVEEGEKFHYVHVISLYPYICKYGKFPVGNPKVYVGVGCPLTVWIGRVLSNVRFYLLENCIIQYFRIKANPN